MLSIFDYGIIIAVLLITLYFGLRYAKNQKSTEAYFSAKGRVPSWAIGMSLLATLISSVTFLGYPAEGFSNNWILLVQGLMVPIVLLGTVWFIVPLYRKIIGLSTYEYFEKRFGNVARYYSSIAFVLRQFSGMGTVLYLLAVALSSMTNINTYWVILVVGSIIVIVNLLGGIEAVIWLDVFQGFMLFASGILCLLVIIFSVNGGLPEVWRVASESGRTGFGPYDLDFTRLTFVVMAINGMFYAIQKYGTDQTVIQRYLTARSDKSAIRASLMGILLTVPVWSLFMFIGTALFVYYTQQPLPDDVGPNSVFPYFIMTQLPVGVVGFILAAMISAAICSLSADLNSLAAVGIEDYYKKCADDGATYEDIEASKKAMSSMEVILGEPSRLERLATDIHDHYISSCAGVSDRIQKAMVVCSNRKIAYALLQKFKDKYPEWFEEKKSPDGVSGNNSVRRALAVGSILQWFLELPHSNETDCFS